MPPKYALLMNGFSKTDAQKLMNGFSKTDSPQGRGPPNRWEESGSQFVTIGLQKNPKKLLDFLSLKK